jgi:hypothetical protein
MDSLVKNSKFLSYLIDLPFKLNRLVSLFQGDYNFTSITIVEIIYQLNYLQCDIIYEILLLAKWLNVKDEEIKNIEPFLLEEYSKLERDKFHDLVIIKGYLNLFKWLYYTKQIHINENTYALAAQSNQKECFEWLCHLKKPHDVHSLFNDMCSRGYLDLAQWYSSYEEKITESLITRKRNIIFYNTIYHGHLHVAQWLFAKFGNLIFNRSMLYFPCFKHNNVEIAKWLYLNNVLIETTNPPHYLMDVGSFYGNLEIIQWFYEIKGHEILEEKSLEFACCHGHLKLVQWLYPLFIEHHISHENMFEVTCLHGSSLLCLDILKWLHSSNVISHDLDFIFENLCCNGKFEIAKWLYETFEIELIPEYFEIVCSKGHLKFAQWIYSKQNFSVFEAFYLSCKEGHLEIAQWIHSINFSVILLPKPFNDECQNGHLDLAKWLYKNNSMININVRQDELFREVCRFGHLDVAKWMYSLCKNIDISQKRNYAFVKACENGHLPVAKWLYSLRKNIDIHSQNNRAFIKACENGHLPVAKWIYYLSHGKLKNLPYYKKCPTITLEWLYKVYPYMKELSIREKMYEDNWNDRW